MRASSGPSLFRVADTLSSYLAPRHVAVPDAPSRADQWWTAAMGLTLALCLTLLLFVSHLVGASPLAAGDVASATYLAPRYFSIIDQSATQAAQQRAAALVSPQFSADPHPQQEAASLASTLLRTAVALRGSATTPGGRQEAATVLTRAADGLIKQTLALSLVTLKAQDLAQVRSLVHQALTAITREPVYPTQLSLLQTAPPFPTTLPDGTVRTVATQVFDGFLRPNYVADAGSTARAQQQAARAVQPVRAYYRRGQAIVRAGDVVNSTMVDALRAANLNGSPLAWQPLIADMLVALVVASFLHGYLISVQSSIVSRPRQLLLLDLLFLATLLAACFVLPNQALLPFIFPAATLSMTITVLLNCELSMVAAATWAVLAGWFLGGSFEICTYYLVTGLAAALLVQRVRSSGQFVLAGLAVSIIGFAAIVAFRLLDQGYDWLGMGTYAAAALVSGGLAAALTLGSFSLLGRLFGVTTALHLLELSHPNHPLLRRLMVEAPGTYHHSIMIGTLAERAAEQIGADPLLVRVSAYFHDIGKLVHPSNYSENQAGVGNVHELLDPRESARLIKEHVTEGVQYARHYHLPQVIQDGILQHHGTNMVGYFYNQAVAMYGEDAVSSEDFRYPGPRPRTRETAILMLADGVEATVRSSPGIDADQIRAIIHRMVQERLQSGQLDDSTLTLRDLAMIEESFATVLQGLSHPRVQYPAPVPAAANQ